ncbi:hypothetical protein BYT27DRAFT_6688756 [Phlegmacium glaucopus]|nr:hypothetical protein BYT27DRAFT_6688756 [Phlegmacium glaucopus]
MLQTVIVTKFNEGRRGGGPRTPHIQSDKGEGSSTGTGIVGESCMTPPYGSSREIISTDESYHTPRMSMQGRPRGPSLSVPSRRAPSQLSRRHDQKSKRAEPWPRSIESDELTRQPNHLTQQPSSSSSQHLQTLDKSRRTKLEAFLDRHGTTRPQNSLQTFQAQELSLPTAKLETPPSTTPPTVPQSHSGAYGYEHRPILPLHQAEPGLRMSSYPEPTVYICSVGRLEMSYHHQHHHYSASGPESSSDTIGAAQAKPKIIRFSSRSENPQPVNNIDAPKITGEKSGEQKNKKINSSPTTRDPPKSSSSSSHQLQSQSEGSSSSSQTQFHFQEPVVPEDHIPSPIRPRELSIIHVKWDSERKRRQGYFAQEEGAEKSPFRHYNKANCDFES